MLSDRPDALKLFPRPESLARRLHEGADRPQRKGQSEINCFADRYFEEALEAGQEGRRPLCRKAGKPRPLEGMPLAVKDAQRVKGKRTTHGSLIFIDNIDDHSDPMIERLTKAGAIILARTTTPEFCLSGVCHSRAVGHYASIP